MKWKSFGRHGGEVHERALREGIDILLVRVRIANLYNLREAREFEHIVAHESLGCVCMRGASVSQYGASHSKVACNAHLSFKTQF